MNGKNKVKRLLYLTLVLLLAISMLSACGQKKGDSKETADNSSGTAVDLKGDPKTLEDMVKSGEVTAMQRVALNDAQLGCEAVRSTAPQDWVQGGDVLWIMQSGGSPAVIDFFVSSPDNRARSGYISAQSYVQPDPTTNFQEGQFDDGWLPSPMKKMMTPEDFLQEYMASYIGYPITEVLSVEKATGDVADMLERERKEAQAMIDKQTSEANANDMYAQSSGTIKNDFALVTMRVNVGDVPCKLLTMCKMSCLDNTVTTADLYNTYSFNKKFWTIESISYYLAEEEVYDQYYDSSVMFQDNLIINQQWRDAISQTSTAIFEQNRDIAVKNFQQIQSQLQQQAQQIASQGSQNYSYASGGSGGSTGSSGSGDYDTNVMGGWTNAITGQSYYEAPDGGSVLLDYNNYNYTDGSNIYSSPQPLDTVGTGLSEMTDLGTMGGSD